MSFNLNTVAVCILSLAIVLNVSPCSCGKSGCYGAAGVTPGINFKLKNGSGNDILTYSGAVSPVPDSIKLKNAATGLFYPLFITQDPGGTLLYSPQYTRPANVIDSLVFYFGSSRPDTLLIYTALVDTHRGDECPMVKSPGINRVMLRNQVLLQTTNDNAVFTLSR